jgi:hypothetical protein
MPDYHAHMTALNMAACGAEYAGGASARATAKAANFNSNCDNVANNVPAPAATGLGVAARCMCARS